MNRWGSNSGLLFLSFLMAVGIVWIKEQDRLGNHPLSGIPVSVENLPSNIVLPDRWNMPETSVTLVGPRNVLSVIRAVQCGFFINFSLQAMPGEDTPQNVILSNAMFRTSLIDERDRERITAVENTIRPRQVSIHLLPWDISQEQPSYEDLLTPESITIPLYRVQKTVPVTAPVIGTPPNGWKLKEVRVDPPEILITGPRDAVDRIRAVSTTTFDLNYLSSEPPPQYMALPDLNALYSVWPVAKTVRGVTVTLKLAK